MRDALGKDDFKLYASRVVHHQKSPWGQSGTKGALSSLGKSYILDACEPEQGENVADGVTRNDFPMT